MADQQPQSIKLTRKRTPPPADLLSRVTSKTPPPHKPTMVPTAEAQLPLMEGQVKIGRRSAAHLSDEERAAAEAAGFEPDMPLPSNAREIIAAVREEMAAQPLNPNVDPRREPLKIPEPVPLSQRSPEHQSRLRQALENAAALEDAEAARQADEARMAMLPPGVGDSMKLASAMSHEEVVDDLSPQSQKPPPQTRTTDQSAESHGDRLVAKAARKMAADTGLVSETGADAKPVLCPHCNWPIGMDDIAEPTHAQKLAFLHTILGQCCYKQEFEVMGGRLRVAFRTLTTKELQLVFAQAYRDLETKRAKTRMDYEDRLNWYRICLQIVHIQSVEPGGFAFVAPEGVKDHNELARSFWEGDEPEPGDTILPQVSEHIETQVLRTESLQRIVAMKCNEFNRVVAKLEANQDNSDFWKPIAGQS